MADSAVSTKGNPAAHVIGEEGIAHVPPSVAQDNALVLQWVREAIDLLEWKHEAVAAAISDATGRSIDGPYLSKMLAGEKPFGAELLRALPDDIEQIVAQKYAEAMGLIVVTPVEGPDALKALISGLVGVLTPRVPMRMAKADLRRRIVRKVAR